MTSALRVTAAGRMVLPESLRRELGVQAGGELVAWREGDRIIVASRETAVRELQSLVASANAGRGRKSAVKEPVIERRAAAKREHEG